MTSMTFRRCEDVYAGVSGHALLQELRDVARGRSEAEAVLERKLAPPFAARQ